MKLTNIVAKTFSHKNLELAWEKVKMNGTSAGIDEGTVAKFEEPKSITAFDLPAHENIIVIVDDEPDLVTIIKGFLKGDGYNVRCAHNGTQLFDVLEKQKPGLILLDIMMPQMDGFEVLARLKGDRETSSIPVILLTEKTQHQDIWAGYNLGADYYMTKPFTSTQLLGAINFIFSRDLGKKKGEYTSECKDPRNPAENEFGIKL